MQVKRTIQSDGGTNSRTRRLGFTLIELLVVVAIIALLISILLPSLNRAREQAKTVVCGTHLKQFATAFQMYFMENNDRLFPYTSRGLGYRLLRKHLENVDEIMMCPSTEPMSDSEKDSLQWHGAPFTSRQAWCWAEAGAPVPPQDPIPDPKRYIDGSYTFNGWLFDPSIDPYYGIAYYTRAEGTMMNDDHPYHFKRLSAVKPTSLVPLMMDGFEQVIYAVNEASRGRKGPLSFEWPDTVTVADLKRPSDSFREDENRSVFTTPFREQLFRAMPDRHPNLQNNINFMDGHVERVSPQGMLELKWGPKFERGNVDPGKPIAWPSFR